MPSLVRLSREMQFGKAQPAILQKEVTSVLGIMQIIGIVHNPLNVALVVAHLHPCLKNIVHFFFPPVNSINHPRHG